MPEKDKDRKKTNKLRATTHFGLKKMLFNSIPDYQFWIPSTSLLAETGIVLGNHSHSVLMNCFEVEPDKLKAIILKKI